MLKKLIGILVLFGTLNTALMNANAENTRPKGVFHNQSGSGEIWCVPIPEDAEEDWVRSMMWDSLVLGQASACDPNLEYLDRGTWGRTTLVMGVDTEGRRATFRFYTLNTQYAWALGSSSRLEKGGSATEFASALSTSDFREKLCAAAAAVGVGAASFEGNETDNIRLAAIRSEVIASEISKTTNRCGTTQQPTVYTLNLGPHKRDDTIDSSIQRSIVLSLVETADKGVNLTEALRGSLKNVQLIEGFHVANYDKFDLDLMN